MSDDRYTAFVDAETGEIGAADNAALMTIEEPDRLIDYLADLSRAIEQVNGVADALVLKDRADAVRFLARKLGVDRDMRSRASEAVIRAERRLGELLAETDRNPGGRPNSLQSAKGLPATYREMGIEPTAAHRWQTVAALEPEKFEQFIQDSREQDYELTSGGIYAYARNSLKGDAPIGPKPPDAIFDGPAAQVLWDLVGKIDRAGRLVIKMWWRGS